MDIKALLGMRPKADTVAALESSLAETLAAVSAKKVIVAEMEARSGTVLLDASPDDVERHEEAIAVERQQIRRMERMAAELPARIKAAAERDARAELDAERRAAEALAERGAKLVLEVEQAGAGLFRLVEDHDKLVAQVQRTNQKLREAGRAADCVAMPTQRVWPNNQVGFMGDSGRPTLLKPLLVVPGPRGAHKDLDYYMKSIDAAKVAPPVDLPLA